MEQLQVPFFDKAEQDQPENMPSMHVHGHHELYFLASGQRRYFIGHTIYDVMPGNLVIIPAGRLHRTTTPAGKGYVRYLLSFAGADVCTLAEAVGQARFAALLESGCVQLPPEAVRQVQRDLEQIEGEVMQPTYYSQALLGHLLQDILLTALRFGKRKAPFSGESADKIQEVARYISENFAQELTLDDVARMACIERTYFSKRFKKLTGVGFYEYLTQTRLREAERLLRQTQLSIGEVAERCGFSGSNYFADVFRRHSGLPPTAYRRAYGQASSRC